MEANEAFSLKHHSKAWYHALLVERLASNLIRIIQYDCASCACIEHGLARVLCVTSKSKILTKTGLKNGTTKIVQ